MIDVLLPVLPRPSLNNANDFVLGDKSPITAIIRDAPVITKDKVTAFRDPVVGNGDHVLIVLQVWLHGITIHFYYCEPELANQKCDNQTNYDGE